jgi:cell division protein FtsW
MSIGRAGSVSVERGHRPDYIFALSVFVLLAFGLIIMYSISPILSQKLLGSTSRNYYFYGQVINIGVGLLAWVVATKINYRRWKAWAPYLMVLSFCALVGLMIPGLSYTTNGATRWLRLGPASFQPAELLKLSTVLYLAAWFDRRREAVKTFWDGLIPFSVMLAGVSFVLIVLQRDMGTAIVLIAASVAMYYVAGARHLHLGVLAMAGLTAIWVAIITFPHRLERLAIFLSPSKDPTGDGYHISQALIAFGSGGLFGRGLGKSLQIFGYLPEAANDSIFAVIGEEVGFAGSVLVVAVFGMLVYKGLKVARESLDTFGQLVAVGVSLWLGFQAAINIAAMLSLVPLTGIPLPFISYGGTSLVFALFGAGILFNISKYTVKEVSHAGTSQRRGNSRSYYANPGNARRVKNAR